MKTLLIARHAKSSWKYDNLTDFERPLNDRGHHDAPRMGGILKERGVRLDLLRSSPANRAVTTARFLAEGLGYPVEQIETDERIYGAGDRELHERVRQLPADTDVVMMVGHNPGMMMLAERLAGFEGDNLPTCGVVCIRFDVNSWSAVEPLAGEILYFEYPKKHKH